MWLLHGQALGMGESPGDYLGMCVLPERPHTVSLMHTEGHMHLS